MNNTLDNGFETNFNTAIKMSGEKYNYSELIGFLSSGKIVEKQIAALELSEIKSKADAKILVSNLIGQDGKVRETVAFKINELAQIPEYMAFFTDENIFDIFLQGLMDINGNVCRQIGDNLVKNKEFRQYLCKKLPESINKILAVINNLDLNSKQYTINKRNFQLYWCLEVLCEIVEDIDIEEIKEILIKTGEFEDYTIREKTAKILAKLDKAELAYLKEKLKNDSNYYVRRYL